MNLTNSNLNENNATENGGVMALERRSKVNITNSIFYNNRAHNGAVITQQTYTGIIPQESILNIRNSNFTQNIAEEYGGVIHNNINCSINIIDSNFNKNNANTGGVINNFGDIIIITNSNFTENTATANGGAINNLRDLIINNTQFSNNKANNNNTIYSTKNFTLKNSNITNNMRDIEFKSTNTLAH